MTTEHKLRTCQIVDTYKWLEQVYCLSSRWGALLERTVTTLTFKRRIKSRLPFAGIIRSSPYSPRFQDKG